MSEEKENKTSKKTFLPEVNPDKTYEFELVGEYKPINFGIGRNSVVYNPVDKGETHIRYVPGWSTIIVADQPDIEERLIAKVDINFANGKLRVPGAKKQYVQYLLLHDHREGNEYSLTKQPQFRLVDNSAAESELYDRLLNQKRALELAETSKFEDVIPYAKVIGIDIKKHGGEKQDEYEKRIRLRFLEKASDNPGSFLKGFEDPGHKRKYDLLLAFEQNIITDAYNDRTINWSESKAKIVDLPSTGANTVDFLTKFTFSENGAEFYKEVKKQVKY